MIFCIQPTCFRLMNLARWDRLVAGSRHSGLLDLQARLSSTSTLLNCIPSKERVEGLAPLALLKQGLNKQVALHISFAVTLATAIRKCSGFTLDQSYHVSCLHHIKPDVLFALWLTRAESCMTSSLSHHSKKTLLRYVVQDGVVIQGPRLCLPKWET